MRKPSPIGKRLSGPQIARRGAAHIQKNHAKRGRTWTGDRINPADTAMPPPGGSMPMGGGGGLGAPGGGLSGGGAPGPGPGAPDDSMGGL